MSDEKHRKDEAADVTEENPVLSEAADATEENPVVTMEAERIGDDASESSTQMVPIHTFPDPDAPAASPAEPSAPPPLPPPAPGARRTRTPAPPLGSPGGPASKTGTSPGLPTVLYLALSGVGLHAGSGPEASADAFLGSIREILGGPELPAGAGRVFSLPSPVKAARAAFELLELLENENASAAPERRVALRFGLARGSLGEAPTESEAYRIAVSLGSSAEAGEILASLEVVEALGSQGVKAERVGKRSVEGLEPLVLVHRLLHVDPTLALPLAPIPAAEVSSPRPPPGRRGWRIVLAAVLLAGAGLLLGILWP